MLLFSRIYATHFMSQTLLTLKTSLSLALFLEIHLSIFISFFLIQKLFSFFSTVAKSFLSKFFCPFFAYIFNFLCFLFLHFPTSTNFSKFRINYGIRFCLKWKYYCLIIQAKIQTIFIGL